MKKVYFPQHGGVATEQNLVQDLVDEQIKLFGSDVFYIPRVHLKDKSLGEVIQSEFSQSYMIEMFLVNVEGFGAGAEFVSKFGLRITDEITFVVSRRRWEQSANPALNLAVDGRPNEGDLIYFPLTEDLYEVKYVERENPFFQLGKQYFYQLTAEIYEQGADKFDTGIDEVDAVERDFSNITTLNLTPSTRVNATGTVTVDSSGAITAATVDLAGTGYSTAPSVTINGGVNASGGIIESSIADGGVVTLTVVNGGTGFQSDPTHAEFPTITIDALEQTGLPALNDNPTISVILSDGTVETGSISDFTDAVITVNSVTKPDGTTASAFTSAPNVNSPYLISSTTLQTQLFRVIQVVEEDDINYTITALSYVEGKYAFIENETALPTRTISVLNTPASPPSNLTVTEQTVVINSIARSKLIVDWQPVVGSTQYLVNYKVENGNYVSQTVFSSDFELLDTVKGTYTIQVFSYNAGLVLSPQLTETTFVAQGKTALPEDVSGLTIEPINEQFVRLRFTQATAIDVLHGGRVYVRHTNQTGGSATFQSAQDVIEAVSGNTTEVIAPALAGTYLLKFQDDGGRFSNGEASVIIDLPDTLDAKLIQTRREDLDVPKFQGTKTSVAFDATTNSLNLTGIGQFDSITDFDLVSSVDDVGGIAPLGTYEFGGTAGGTTLDLGDVFSLDLKRHFLTEAFFPSDLFDSIPDLDARGDFEGLTATEVNAEMLVRVTQDNPNTGSPTYSSFQTFTNGTYKGRGFQFKVNLTSDDPAQDIRVFQLGYTASMQRRTEQSPSTTASGSGAKAITFQHPFFVGTATTEGGANSILPSVGITAQNMQSGDFFEISNVSGTGFTVHFKNSSNASVDRNFTYQAVGFGKAS